jgi:hypothetical protein
VAQRQAGQSISLFLEPTVTEELESQTATTLLENYVIEQHSGKIYSNFLDRNLILSNK